MKIKKILKWFPRWSSWAMAFGFVAGRAWNEGRWVSVGIFMVAALVALYYAEKEK